MTVVQPNAPAAISADPRQSTETLYAMLTLVAAVFFVTVEGLYIASWPAPSFWVPTMDGLAAAIGRDFLNTWMGGRSALAGGPAPWFDAHVYNGVLRDMLGPAYPQTPQQPYYWSYPPHLILFTWPFGLLPYLPAFVAWCGLGLAGFVAAARAGDVERRYLPFLAFAPAVVVNVFFGQNGFVTSGLLVFGLAILDRRPILAGVMFGILTIKPQLGLLLPLVLLLTGRWRVIAAAAATAAFLVALTAWLYGIDVWVGYLTKVGAQQAWLLHHASGLILSQNPSALYAARRLGLSLDLAWMVQILTSALTLAAVAWTFARRRDPVLSQALLVTAVFLVTPYSFCYDMVVFGWVLALLLQRQDNTPLDHGLILAVWVLPLAMMIIGVALEINVAFPLLAAFAIRLLVRLSREPQIAATVRFGAAYR
jgi:alpha-1,2-mannosyltransferase